jgi:predicted RNase H-like nuclease (RuvC/YqgF family)
MSEDNDSRLSVYEKAQLARQHEELNLLLRQIKTLKDERNIVLKEAAQMQLRIDALENEFNHLVITVAPTEVISVKRPPKQLNELSLLTKALKERLPNSPGLEEQLRKILNIKET